MRSRAIVFDLFGDYVRYHGGSIRLGHLVRLLGRVGISDSTVRMAMSRLRRAEWFDVERDGREAVYALNERSISLLDAGRVRIFQRRTEEWDRQWHLAVYSVPETDRVVRDQLRKALAWTGYGPLAGSTWISPDDHGAHLRDAVTVEAPATLDLFTCSSEGPAADLTMAQRCWDLDALALTYEEVLARLSPKMTGYRSGHHSDATAFVERLELIHDYRRIPLRDPDLPADLLPDDWPGHHAHELFLEAHDLLAEPANRHYLETVGLTGRDSDGSATKAAAGTLS